MIMTRLDQLSKHLQDQIKEDLQAYEKFVESVPHTLVRELFDFQTNQNLTTELPLSVMTFIAIGGSIGSKLEKVFPEFAGANPNK
ncbi:hypothetical protein F0M16_10905 [Vibrio cholerae]|uniref:Uncharacterized protein n=1 Tax=Vibrio cholerae TaxID=666 RepID=A0A5Q6PIR6_VIBCL|nr:hypothetical protein [Vibrio cholerae]KAA1254768.1 hypothetical protein F0M16_10905 [Vibrio cholerae]